MSEARIAYFSMEIALHPAMPTYSGGLGMLAGDMLQSSMAAKPIRTPGRQGSDPENLSG